MLLLRLILTAAFTLLLCQAEPADNDNVQFDDEVISELIKSIESFHNDAILQMPENIRNQVLKAEKMKDLAKLPIESQSWLNDNAFNVGSLDLANSAGRLIEMLRRNGDRVEMHEILEETFWCKLHGKPSDIESLIRSDVIYWREVSIPNVKFSPQGQNEIQWIWQLEVKERPNGTLHVGLDVKKRTFICFDRKVGVFFPEGETMERIYREIVQVPSRARDHIGQGRISKKW